MRFWLVLAVIIGAVVGRNAQHEQAQWQARQAAIGATPLVVAGPVTADRQATADPPLAWRVPWLSGVAAAVVIIGIGVAAEASARELAAEAGER